MIEVAMRCPCGAHAVVDITPAFTSADGWSCKCPECYMPDSESSRRTCLGHGKSPGEAVAAWWEQVEAGWDLPRYEPNMLFADLSEQAGDEAERQEGWMEVWATDPTAPRSACWYGPEVSP
jgi:hypothetical protein